MKSEKLKSKDENETIRFMKSRKTEKILLGIDPGTNVMGYGVLRVVGNKE